jgi:predicted MFS family arabinose efflux permease
MIGAPLHLPPGGDNTDRAGQPHRQAHPAPILFALWLMVFTVSSQISVIIPVLPRVGAALSIPEPLYGTLVSAYAITLSVVALLGGPLSDRLGRHRIMLLGSIGMAATLFLHLTAHSYASLFCLRALTGISGGLLSGAAVAYIGDYFPRERRGWATGYVISGVAFGQMIGIPAGALLAERFDFRWAFVLFGALMAGTGALVWRVLPAVPPAHAHGRVTLRHLLGSYRSLQRQPAAVMAVLSNLLAFTAIHVYLIYLPAWLERTLAFSSTQMASLFFVGGTASVLASPLVGRISDRVGQRPLIVSAFVVMGLAALLTTLLVSSAWSAYLVFTVMMFVMTLRNVPYQSLLTMLVADGQRGTLTSMSFSAGQIGMGLGGLVAGPVYAGHGFLGNCVVAALITAALAILVQRWFPQHHVSSTQAATRLPPSSSHQNRLP